MHITLWSAMKANWCFRWSYLLHLQAGEQAKHETGTYLLPASYWFLAWLTVWPQRWEQWGWHVPLEWQLPFNRLHGIIAQKRELFFLFSLSLTSAVINLIWLQNHRNISSGTETHYIMTFLHKIINPLHSYLLLSSAITDLMWSIFSALSARSFH
jgi:hypothetical protein